MELLDAPVCTEYVRAERNQCGRRVAGGNDQRTWHLHCVDGVQRTTNIQYHCAERLGPSAVVQAVE